MYYSVLKHGSWQRAIPVAKGDGRGKRSVPAASPGRLQDREDHVHHTQGYQLNGDASEVFGDSRMEDFLAEGIVEYQHEKDTDNCAQPFRYMVQDKGCFQKDGGNAVSYTHLTLPTKA